MPNICLDEIEYAKRALENKDLGEKPTATLFRIAKYYRATGIGRADKIARLLSDFLLDCIPDANMYRWGETIEKIAKSSKKYPPVTIKRIYITQKELDTISKLKGIIEKRILFTLMCLAKYKNAIKGVNSNWVNYSISFISALANVKLGGDRRDDIFRHLIENGLLETNRCFIELNFKVLCVDNEGEGVLEITDFRNLGFQYMKYIGGKFLACEECGLVVSKTSPRQKYCKDCYKKIHLKQMTEAVKKQKEYKDIA